jgi:hypothetical protein
MDSLHQHGLQHSHTRRSGPLTLAACLLLWPALGFAECETSVYAFDKFVVFNSCAGDGTPRLNMVVLDDAARLQVRGRVVVPSQRGIDAFAHSGDQLIVLRWDRLEIYDLTDAAHPTLAASFQLAHRASTPGYPRIEQTAPNSFLVLGTVGAVELKQQAGGSKWTLNELPDREEFGRKMSQPPPEHRFDADDVKTIPLRETAKFRYELVWRHQTRPGEAIRRQYLRRVGKAKGRFFSQLPVRETVETID